MRACIVVTPVRVVLSAGLCLAAAGLNQNVCVAIPEWEMVIVRMGLDGTAPGGHAGVLNAFLRRLGMAVSPLGNLRAEPPAEAEASRGRDRSKGSRTVSVITH